jgi:hypothetical protein
VERGEEPHPLELTWGAGTARRAGRGAGRGR